MPTRHLPVRPNLKQLRHQAKELLRAIHSGDPSAVQDLAEFHPEFVDPESAQLADAQLALARSYQASSWPRLVLACQLIDAIWLDDVDRVSQLVSKHRHLLIENAGIRNSNWGPPMTYAANLGRDRIIDALHEMGATDLMSAMDRAALQSKIATARKLHAMADHPTPPRGAVMGPAETLSAEGFEFALEIGAGICDSNGDAKAPVALVLETYSRNPVGKHRILETMEAHGVALPQTAPMAVHRGRIDLLEAHLRRDPQLLGRTFSHEEIYPPELGCHEDHTLALHGTPVAGGTLLHLCVDGDEFELAKWLIDKVSDVDQRAAVDADGFGGHTALFGCVVSQPYRVGIRRDDAFARLLLDSGADPNVRASLRKRLRFVADEGLYEYRDVTPLGWGQRFHDQDWVNESAMRLIVNRGGQL